MAVGVKLQDAIDWKECFPDAAPSPPSRWTAARSQPARAREEEEEGILKPK